MLGELEVEGVRRERLGGPKQRAMLAYLLLHANELVPRDRLIDAVWGDEPPPTARSIVHGYVRKLRAALDGTGARIVARPPGYVFELEPEDLDVRRFERLAADGREALAAGHPGRARELLTDALALWRGEPLADLAYEPAVEAEARRLEGLRLEATMDRIAAELELGADAGLVGELETLVSQHPFTERLRGQLMLALYRAGRQADALETYRAARGALAEELGIEPGRNLRQLEEAILRHDPTLETPHSNGQPPPQWGRSLRTAVAAILVITAAVATVALVVSRSNGAARVVAANSVGIIDPKTNKLVGQVAVGIRPGDVEVGRSGVWVANLDDGTLSRIDPRTRAVVRTIPLSNVFPDDLAIGGDVLWIADGRSGTIGRVSTTLDRIVTAKHFKCSSFGQAAPASVAVGAGGVWFVCGNTLGRIDSATNRLRTLGYAGLRPTGIAVGLGAVWVANGAESSVSRIDPRTMRIADRLNVASAPRGVTVGDGSVWVPASAADVVSRLLVPGPGVPIPSESVRVGHEPVDVAAGEGAIWVANSGAGTVSRVNPRTQKVVATIRVGNRPAGIAAGDGRVWVAVQAKAPSGLR